MRHDTHQTLKLTLSVSNNNYSDACLNKWATSNSPSSQMMAMQARTMRSLSCSPSFPTAIREFVKELGKSSAFTVIIWTGKITDWDEIHPTTQITYTGYAPSARVLLEVVPFWPVWGLEFSPPRCSAECQYTWTQNNTCKTFKHHITSPTRAPMAIHIFILH